MAIRRGSTEVYNYDIPRFLGYVCVFVGFLPVLLCGNLAFITLANYLFGYLLSGRLPEMVAYERSRYERVGCIFNINRGSLQIRSFTEVYTPLCF